MSAPEHTTGATPGDASEGARCEYCGLPYADGGAVKGGTASTPSPAPEPAGGESGDEPTTETHCEYCGVEYPIPRREPGAG